AAALLPRNRVLVTGGSPTAPFSGVSCNDCDAGSSVVCASGQAALYSWPMSSLAVRPHLQIARFRHSATLLRDRHVRVGGGIGSTPAPEQPRVLGDAEVYNPRPAQPELQAGSGNPDPDDPIAGDLGGDKGPRAPGAILAPNLECRTL